MKIAIFGSGGISKEIAFLIEDISSSPNSTYKVLGFIEATNEKKGSIISGYPILGDYKTLDKIGADAFALPIGDPKIKQDIYKKEILKVKKSLKAPNLIHPNVIYRKNHIKLGIGNIICAGNILTTDIQIGNFNLINLNCTIGHDIIIGNFNVINPIVALSGGVEIGNNVSIGTGAKILQYKKICDNSIIGAGAVVTKNITESGTYAGVPAKRIK